MSKIERGGQKGKQKKGWIQKPNIEKGRVTEGRVRDGGRRDRSSRARLKLFPRGARTSKMMLTMASFKRIILDAANWISDVMVS